MGSIAKEVNGPENQLQLMPNLHVRNMSETKSKQSPTDQKSSKLNAQDKKQKRFNRYDAERSHSKRKKGKEGVLLSDDKSARKERKSSHSHRKPHKKDNHYLSPSYEPNQLGESKRNERKGRATERPADMINYEEIEVFRRSV